MRNKDADLAFLVPSFDVIVSRGLSQNRDKMFGKRCTRESALTNKTAHHAFDIDNDEREGDFISL
jgi:hypothetical protein